MKHFIIKIIILIAILIHGDAKKVKSKKKSDDIEYYYVEGEEESCETDHSDETKFMMTLMHQTGSREDYDIFCLGTLISSRWILTSASCVVKYNDIVAISSNDIYDVDKYEGEVLTVKKIHIHPNWNQESMENNIALLNLEYDLYTNNDTKYAKLPKDQLTGKVVKDIPCKYVTTIGMGDLAPPESIVTTTELPQHKRELTENTEDDYEAEYDTAELICAKLKPVNFTFCKSSLGPKSKIVITKEHNLCIEGNVPESFELELGGPLVCEGIQYGILSKRNNKISIYTRVGWYSDFINHHIQPGPWRGGSNGGTNIETDISLFLFTNWIIFISNKKI